MWGQAEERSLRVSRRNQRQRDKRAINHREAGEVGREGDTREANQAKRGQAHHKVIIKL